MATPQAESVDQIIAQAQSAFRSQDRDAALAILQAGIQQFSGDPRLWAEHGRLLCLLQREDEAIACLEASWPSDALQELATTLAAHVACRAQIAAKLGVDDAVGVAMTARLNQFGIAPHADRGVRISATLIVKNESNNLRACLESLVDHVDEIVVVDTGSTDDTVAIAESFGAKLGYFEWSNDFSAARNAALDLATGDWALWIDADEVVDGASWNSIWEAVVRPQFGGYFVPIVNFTDDAQASQYTHAPVRLFQNRPEIRFEGKIHEQIAPSIDRLNLPIATLQNAKLLHYGYMPAQMEAKQKVERTITALLAEIEANPDDSFHWFNLANVYSVAQRYDDSAHAARECLKRMEPGNAFGSLTYQLLQSALNSTDQAEAAFDVALEAKRSGYFSILNQFELAHSLLMLGKPSDALIAIDACMAMPWAADMTGDKGIVTHKSHTLKGQILIELGEYEAGLVMLEASNAIDPHFGLTQVSMAIALEKLGRFDEARVKGREALNSPSVAFQALKTLARIEFAVKSYEAARDYAHSALQARPNDKEAWIFWTKSLEALDDVSARLLAYQDFVERHGPHADVLVNWGRALIEQGQTESGVAKLVDAIEEDPANVNAHLNLGDTLYQLGAYAEAANQYETALRLDGTNPEAWFCLGNAAAQMGAGAAALASYRQALTLDPEHAKAAHNMALVEQEFAAA